MDKKEFTTYGIGLLILAVSLSPRIPLPFYVPARLIEIRAEDIILSVLLFVWLLRITRRPLIYATPLIKPISIYFLIGLVTSLIGMWLLPESFARVILYNLKDLQYFLIFLLIANWVQSFSAIRKLYYVLIIAVFVNAIWTVSQILIGKNLPMFYFNASPEAFYHHARATNYGVVTIGEFSPFSVCLFYSFGSFMGYSYYFQKKKTIFLLLGILFTTLSVLTGEKASFGILIIGLCTLVFLREGSIVRKFKKAMLMSPIIIVLIILKDYLIQIMPYTSRVFSWESYILAFTNDRFDVWQDYFPHVFDNLLIGAGKGSFGLMRRGEMIFIEELHNHYFKVLLEYGIFGLIAFIWLLFKAAEMVINVYKNSTHVMSKIISGTALCALLSLAAMAAAQDAFKPVLPNELFWIFLGLTAAAYRIERGTRALGAVESN